MFKGLRKIINIAFWSFIETIYLNHIGMSNDIVFPEDNSPEDNSFEPYLNKETFPSIKKMLDEDDKRKTVKEMLDESNKIKDKKDVKKFLSDIGMD